MRKYLWLIKLLFVQSRLSISRLWRKPKAKPDYRGVPTHACPCGEMTFFIRAVFEDYAIALYGLDGECVSCGALVTVPCEVDRDASV